eukprot:COSAG04_NODE_16310_length_503_cov_1.049505_2_plen_75_part_01
MEQFPGCFASTGCLKFGHGDNCCPQGIAMWERYEFRASNGAGGAISTAGSVAVEIRNTVFSTNEAPKGASLAFTA